MILDKADQEHPGGLSTAFIKELIRLLVGSGALSSALEVNPIVATTTQEP